VAQGAGLYGRWFMAEVSGYIGHGIPQYISPTILVHVNVALMTITLGRNR